MSDRNIPSESSTMLSDRQTDALLTAFFEHEVPARLNDGFSAATKVSPSDRPAVTVAALRVAEHRDGQSARSSARSLTAIAGMLLACMIIALAGWRFSVAPGGSGSTLVDRQSDSPESPLMDVSTDPGENIPVDDSNTSLIEIEQIDLSPQDDRE